jgi:hypothetical protein
MKKLTALILLLLVLIFLVPSAVSADVIAPGTHSFARIVKFVNLDEFPDIAMFYDTTGPLTGGRALTYPVENDKPLDLGYKANKLSLYWNTKGNVNSVDKSNLGHSLPIMSPYAGYIDDSNPLAREEIQYSIAGFYGETMVIYVSQYTSEYNNGCPSQVIAFNNPFVDVESSPTPDVEPPPTPDVESSPTPATESEKGFGQSLLYEQKFLLALLLTLVVEISLADVIIRFLFKRREITILKIVFAGFVASVLTLPYLWFILPFYVSNMVLYVFCDELLVILVEAIIYNQFLKLKLPQSFVVSLIANVASVLLGIILI